VSGAATPHRFASAGWAAALREELNASSEYRNAAAKWGVGFNGTVLLAFEPDAGLAAACNLLLRLQAGRCEGAEFVPDATHPDAGFVLAAPFSLWRDVLERRTLAATAILTGRLRLTGDRMTLLRHTAAHRALLHCVASLDTSWDPR
jgi:putative sterol carrier protein